MATADPDSHSPVGGAAVDATLRPLLTTQFARLRRRWSWFGVALTLAACGLALLLFVGLDVWLRLPLPIRLIHTAALVALAVAGTVRFVRYPLSRRFDDVDLAAWIETTFPELHQRLVSTLQLQASGGDLRNQSQAMIDRLAAETASIARELPLDRLFDDRRTRRIVGSALGVCLAVVGGATLHPAVAKAFVLRHLGFAAEYPRETDLVIELPDAGPDLQRRDEESRTELVLPAGADLHVSVLAKGRVPKDVFLDVAPIRSDRPGANDPRAVAMTPRPGDRFRHVFRRVAGAFEFHARGGDDDRGDRVVVVRTVHPPQVATLQANVTPPAYTGAETSAQTGGAIEGLTGSSVELLLATTAAVQQATMVFLESGRRLPMQPTTVQDDSAASTAWRVTFVVETSDRYQIELVAGTGLRNPNPGTYPIAALQDYAPVGKWLLPDDEALLVLPNALLCVRLDTRDDFGLRAARFTVERAGGRTLDRDLLAQPASDAPATVPTKGAILTEIFEVAELLGAAATPAAANDSLSLRTTLRDNRLPEANTTELPQRIVQIVDPAQLAASIARTFRTLREDLEHALEIQTDRRARIEDLLTAQNPATTDVAQILTGAEVGQGRVNNAIERAHRTLMRSFDVHLWNRLETSQNAAQVVDLYRQRSRELLEPLALDPAFYRDLTARRRAGTLGSMETTLDPILTMVSAADLLVTGACPVAARALAEAQVARGNDDRRPLLERAKSAAVEIERSLQQLLARLEEWNDYQDLIQETRALRDRQRDLQDRTDAARGKK